MRWCRVRRWLSESTSEWGCRKDILAVSLLNVNSFGKVFELSVDKEALSLNCLVNKTADDPSSPPSRPFGSLSN